MANSSKILDLVRSNDPKSLHKKVQEGVIRNRAKLLRFVEAVDAQNEENGGGSPKKIHLSESAKRLGLRLDPKFSKAQDKNSIEFRNRLLALMNKLGEGRITKRSFLREVRRLLESAHLSAWKFGLQSLNPNEIMTDFDIEKVAEIVDKQMVFVDRMHDQIKDRKITMPLKNRAAMHDQIKDKKITMPLKNRAAMYASATDGAFEEAAITRMKGVWIYWRLTAKKSCVTCVVLAANSPYTAGNLPTVPRAGRTICLTQCKCFLDVKRGREPKSEITRRVRAVIGKGGIDFSIEAEIQKLRNSIDI